MSITNKTRTYIDFQYQTNVNNPELDYMRVFADNIGRFAYRSANGITIALDSSNINESRVIRLPNSDGTMMSNDSIDELNNKTIDSNANTITIGSININDLVNQDVRRAAGPMFSSVNIGYENVNKVQMGYHSLDNVGYIMASVGLDIGGQDFNAIQVRSDTTSFLNTVALQEVSLDNSVGNILCIDSDGIVCYRDNIVTDIITGKTIDSAFNTIQVNGTNINTLIGQSVTTAASPIFVSETLTGRLTIGTSAAHPIIVDQSSTTTTNDILFQKTGVDVFGVGTNETTNESYTWTHTSRDYKIGTGNTERLRIPAAGISNNNSITNILGLQGTTLVYKNDLVDIASTQTLANKTLTSPVIATISNTGTLTLPVVTTTLVGRDTTDTLTNKTLTSPVIVSISNTGTLTLPTSTTTLVGRDTTDTLTNKSIVTTSCRIVDGTDNTKRVAFDNSAATTGTTTTLSTLQTVDRVITFPNITDTVTTNTAVQTLTNKTLTMPIISTITNTGTLTLPTATTILVGRDTTDILTNKTLTSPVIATISNAGTLTLPTSTTTLVGRDTTDTLTNKTLTTPIIATISNTGTLTLPTVTTTLVGRDTTDTLTNKTIDSATNTMQIDGISVASLINQDVRTTATPTFAAVSLTNGVSSFSGNIYEISGSQVINVVGPTTIYTLPTVSNHSYLIEIASAAFVTSGTNIGKGMFQRTLSGATNNGGVMTVNNILSNVFILNGIPAGPSHSVTASGTNVLLGIIGNAADTFRYRWWGRIYLN